MSAVSSSGASSSDDRYRQSLPLPSIEKLQININTDPMASSSTTSTVACTDVGSIDSFMDAKCDTSTATTSTTTPCGAAEEHGAHITSPTLKNNRCTLDQALDSLMQRRKSERHHLSIARDLLERLEDDEEDFSSDDDDSDDDEEPAQHISTVTTSRIYLLANASEVRMPNIERELRSLSRPKRRERHPFAVAELFLQDLEEEEEEER